ncbi:MAG TPA: WD40 repeat domain-containing protein [Thermoanaerobaculia bacterium]|nr:WD40 repeat domain-containing protein [Thermoanaerobaculia bacterium]
MRPFEPQEDYLFFGRETHIDELLRRLRRHRFLSIVGTSGSGKSSLVRAGLLPALYGGFMAQAGSRWRVAVFRPGSDPIGHLATALNHPDVCGSSGTGREEMYRAMIEATLSRSSRGLIEAARQAPLPSGENLLVVVDQFEELFRYRSALHKGSFDEASAFVRLLVEASRHEEIPIYVVLTMRSDFLGDCAQFQGLPEVINEGQYLIPRLTRDQIRQAIVGPIAVGGGEIAPHVVELLLNDVGDNPDHLPILQHALMRTWDFWLKDHAEGEPIQLRHYEAIGGMREELSRHADEAFNELDSEAERALAERLFRSLTEKGPDNREIRRPTRLADLCATAGAPQDEVVAVIDRFRRHDRSFLMPPADTPLAPNTVIDISHESLMRVWSRLCAWVEEESRSVETYRRVAETAALYERGRAGLWRDPDLSIALSWRADNQPNMAWATHYAPGFERAMAFLDASREAAEAKKAAAEAQRRRKLRRTRLFVATLSAAFVLSLIFLFYAMNQARLARSRQLALESTRQLNTDQELSLLLAVEAARAKGSREAEGALRNALLHPGRIWRLLSPPGPHEELWHVAWSPDGRRLVTTGRDGVVRLWDLEGNNGPVTLGSHEGGVSTAAWDPAGRRVLTASFDGSAKIWDTANRAPAVELRGHASAVNRAVWNAAGERVATAGLDGTVRVWDAASGAPLGVLRGHAGSVLDVAWSPDGVRLASAGTDGTARIWNAGALQPAAVLSGHTDEVTSVAWSPDGRWLATGSRDHRWRVWDPQTGGGASAGEGHKGGLVQVAWSPDGQLLATAGKDGVANLWDWRGSSVRRVLAGHTSELTGISWDKAGKRLLTSSLDGTARVWNAATGGSLAVMAGHSGSVAYAAWDPFSERVATAGQDGTARVWDVDAGSEVAVLRGPTAGISEVAWDPAGRRLAAASLDGTSRVWDAESGREVARLNGSRLGTLDAAWDPAGGRIATADRDGTARLWKADGRLLTVLRGHRSGVSRAVWSGDGRRVATASLDRTVRVWDADSGRELRAFAHDDWVRDVAWSPGGDRLATASFDWTARIWTVDRDAPSIVLSGHTSPVLFVAWSPDGKRLLTGSVDRTARIWDAATGAQTALLVGHEDWVVHAAWSPDGKRIATAGADRTARIWNAASGMQEHLLTGHSGRLRHVSWSPDGEHLATTSDTGEVILWDTQSGELRTMLQGHAGRVEQAAWRPDGRRIATASYDGTVRVFFREVDDLMRIACQRAVRNLSRDEWKRFLTGPYRATCAGGSAR